MAKTKTAKKTKIAARPIAKSASRKPKSSTGRPAAMHKGQSVSGKEVTVDRRRGSRRDETQAEAANKPAATQPKLERRQKVNRRRQIDPTTCERDYTDQEVAFMNALDDYKRANGRMFPTCSEVLEVVRSLGYVQLSPAELSARTASQPLVATAAIAEAEASEESADDWR